MATPTTLVKMANQLGQFFKTYPDRRDTGQRGGSPEALLGAIVAHLPAQSGESGLTPLAVATIGPLDEAAGTT